MINATLLFELAQLAEASYASLDSNMSLTDALTNTNPAYNKMSFSAAQAAEFATHWSVTAHQKNTTSGYSSTLFKNLDADGAGYVLAIRGTESENFFGSEDLTAIRCAKAHPKH